VGSAVEAIRTLWMTSGDRLLGRCAGLSDDEYFWEPAPGSWNVVRSANGWTYPYEFAPEPPAPVTTIAWRLVHIAADNWIYWEWAFGPGERTFPDLVVASTAAEALQDWQDSRVPITEWLLGADDDQLAEGRPSHLGGTKTAGEVIAILIDEQIHHGAEIALLRDLYPRRSA
jgi:uncharacterized damage-inducible protein DinB